MPDKEIACFALHPLYKTNEEDYKTRQISVMVEDAKVAVITSHKHNEKWSEPKFTVLRAQLTYKEMTGLGFSMRQAQDIMKILGSPNTKLGDLESIVVIANKQIAELYNQNSNY